MCCHLVGHVEGQLHATLAADAGGGHHIVPVRVRSVPHELRVYLSAAGLVGSGTVMTRQILAAGLVG